MLDWYVDPALRRRVTIGLNKGEARNALARAFFLIDWEKSEIKVLKVKNNRPAD